MEVDRRARPRTPPAQPYRSLVVVALGWGVSIAMLLCVVLPFLTADPDALADDLFLPGLLLAAALCGGVLAVNVSRAR